MCGIWVGERDGEEEAFPTILPSQHTLVFKESIDILKTTLNFG